MRSRAVVRADRSPASARFCVGLALLAAAAPAGAHVASDLVSPGEGADVLVVTSLIVLAAGLYAAGLMRVWTQSARGRRELVWRALAFAGGLLVLALALLSPLDRWSAELFSMHMIQHELLMLAAAPLLVMGRPLPVWVWAFGQGRRASVSRITRPRAVRVVWAALVSPGIAWMCHALALWVWHVPKFFDAVLVSRPIHDLQHVTFLATALMFWAALFEERSRERRGAGILYLFTTTVHASILGALITFAARPWYSAYLQTPTHWGFSALEDQQLGGLIMWVPGSIVYVGTALVLLARWIAASDRAQLRAR
jgi:cytochrome c oxidase assembly factor CtaG